MAPLKVRDRIGGGAASEEAGGPHAAPLPDPAPNLVLTGRAMLAGGRDFACSALQVTTTSAEIVAKVAAEPGQSVVCHLDGIGLVAGWVAAATDRGFTMALTCPEAQRERIAGRLAWFAGRAARTAALRAAPRIVPLHTSVEVRLGEAIVLPGRILNVSISGAAIALGACALPFVSARVRVGSRYAGVVRLLAAGIAVQFDEPFLPDHFDERVRL